MDKIERFYKEHAAEMDQMELRPEVWEKIAPQLRRPTNLLGQYKWIAWLSAAVILIATSLWGIDAWYKKSNQQPAVISDIFPDIQLSSPSGSSIPLSSLDNKVVLVKFWASWCNVCREHNCDVLLPLYDEYKAKGFEIYAVSLDEDMRQWQYGIERDKLPWIQVSDLKGFASPVSQQFGVSSTNTTFLLDKNRKVIGKNLSREALSLKLQQSCN